MAEAKREGLEINPVPGKELQKIVAEVAATPGPIANRLSQMIAVPEAMRSRER